MGINLSQSSPQYTYKTTHIGNVKSVELVRIWAVFMLFSARQVNDRDYSSHFDVDQVCARVSCRQIGIMGSVSHN